jgi:hypothetical protein
MVDTERPRSALLVSEPIGFVAKQAMKTAGRENPNRCATHSTQQPKTMARKARQILLNQTGCEARKTPAVAEVFLCLLMRETALKAIARG